MLVVGWGTYKKKGLCLFLLIKSTTFFRYLRGKLGLIGSVSSTIFIFIIMEEANN